MFRNGAWNLDYLKLHWWRISEQQQFAWIRRKEETLNDTIELIAICPYNIAVMLIKYDEEESGGCVSINGSEKNLFASKILFQRKLGGGKRGDETRSLDHRIEFFVADSMKQGEDFEIKTLSRDSELFPKFQSYFSSIHVSPYRVLWSWIASCFELLRSGEGRRDEKEGKKETLPSLTRAASFAGTSYYRRRERISYPNNFQCIL